MERSVKWPRPEVGGSFEGVVSKMKAAHRRECSV